MARKKIEAYKTSGKIRSMIENEHFYSAESITSPGVTYVLDTDEIAIVTRSTSIRLPVEICEELMIMTEYVLDPDNRAMIERRNQK